MRKTVYLVLFALVVCFGCIGSMMEDRTDKYLDQSMTITKVEENPDFNNPEPGSCQLLLCQNQTKTGVLGWLKKYFYYSVKYGEFFDPSLIGGSCWLHNLTAENREETLKNWSEGIYYPREVGLGQGLTFADFNQANLYCNNSLRYSLKLVRSMESGRYLFSPKSNAGAACFLDKSVIPVYILYNNGTVPVNDNSREIASQMNGIGPVMIASELNPSSDSNNLERIGSQISMLRLNCPNCIVGASVTMKDISLLNWLNESGILQYVDFVGFGIDSNYMDGTCGDSLALLSEAQSLSFFVEKQFKKPTFWYYVSLNRTQCRWTDYEERKLYSLMFQDIPRMSKSGLIGMSPVPFYDSAFIYPNSNNSFFISTASGNDLRQNASSSWFSLCRQYYGNQNYKILSIDTSPSDIACAQVLMGLPEKKDFYSGNIGDFVPLQEITINDKEATIYQCKACFIAYDSKTTPAFLKDSKVAFDSGKCKNNSDAIEFYADLYDIDPNLLRAFAAAESGFESCAISPYVSESDGINKCTGAAILKSDISIAAAAAGCNLNAMPEPPSNANNPDAKYSICALGMMQTTTMPGNMYGMSMYNNVAMPEDVKACGGDNFNPFNATHSICAASYRIMSRYLPDAYSAVSSNKGLFAISGTDEDNANMMDALTVALTAASYHGEGSSRFVTDYRDIKANGGKTGDCTAMTKVVKDLCCTYHPASGNTPASFSFSDTDLCKNPNPITILNRMNVVYLGDSKHYSHYSVDLLGRYLSATESCGGCTKEEWFKNTCDKIKIYAPNANCQ